MESYLVYEIDPELMYLVPKCNALYFEELDKNLTENITEYSHPHNYDENVDFLF